MSQYYVVLCRDKHWEITTPVAICKDVESAICHIESLEKDQDLIYYYRATEMIE